MLGQNGNGSFGGSDRRFHQLGQSGLTDDQRTLLVHVLHEDVHQLSSAGRLCCQRSPRFMASAFSLYPSTALGRLRIGADLVIVTGH